MVIGELIASDMVAVRRPAGPPASTGAFPVCSASTSRLRTPEIALRDSWVIGSPPR
jgi:hypothetical protein